MARELDDDTIEISIGPCLFDVQRALKMGWTMPQIRLVWNSIMALVKGAQIHLAVSAGQTKICDECECLTFADRKTCHLCEEDARRTEERLKSPEAAAEAREGAAKVLAAVTAAPGLREALRGIREQIRNDREELVCHLCNNAIVGSFVTITAGIYRCLACEAHRERCVSCARDLTGDSRVMLSTGVIQCRGCHRNNVPIPGRLR